MVKRKHIKKSVCFFTLIIFAVLISTGCDSVQFNNDKKSNLDGIESIAKSNGLNINSDVLYMVTYNQTEVNLSTRMPERVENTTSKFVLKSYQNTNQTVVVDRRGYIHTFTEWIDGSADDVIPKEVKRHFSSIMPATGNLEEQVVRSEVTNGFIRYFSDSGKVLHEYAVDQEQFRIHPSELNTLLGSLKSSNAREENISKNLQKLENRGVHFEKVGNKLARFSETIGNDRNVVRSDFLMDLEIGKVVSTTDYGPSGLVYGRGIMKYEKINQVPVMKYMMSENYSEKDGSMQVSDRTIINRSNINLHLNTIER